jgi:ribosomal-protein-alanine N-acetyltransferase
MNIRPFRSEDLPILRDITVDAFDGVSIDQGIEREFGPIRRRDWKWRKGRHVDTDAREAPDGIFVAEIDGRPVGYISTSCDLEAGIGWIRNLAFLPEHRGRGFGRRLIEHACDHFRRSGCTHAKIETLEQNAIGNHLYRSLGFREVARQIHFVADLTAPQAPPPSAASEETDSPE